jgi:tetratricopeptide (TPR) repeat protein
VLLLSPLLVVLLVGSGQACSWTSDMPPHVPRLVERALAHDEYLARAEAWRTYRKQHPGAGIAWVEEERALRYAHKLDFEQQRSMMRQAVEADPDCALAVDRLANLEFQHAVWGDGADVQEARRLAERALALAPDDWQPHQTLWMMDVVSGDAEAAAQHMAACLDLGTYSSPLLDYAYNMLVTAAPDAIVFTNGDNDTFPLLALQARHGIRSDVRVVNLSMAAYPGYAKLTLHADDGSGPLTSAEIDALQDRTPSGTPLGHAVAREVARKVAEGDWAHPVYAAITVADVTSLFPNRLEMQGLLYRIRSQRVDDDTPIELDVARTDSLFEYVYRMESAMDLGFRWDAQPAVEHLIGNYIGGYRRMLAQFAADGDLEASRRMLRNLLPLLEFHGTLRRWEGRDRAEMLLDYWGELDPDNPEVDRWRRRLSL